MRKVAYVGGAILSLFIWAVPEGLGGPYSPGSTDIGTGFMYALLFVSLILINATYGPSKWRIDHLIETRFPRWAWIPEFQPPPWKAETPPDRVRSRLAVLSATRAEVPPASRHRETPSLGPGRRVRRLRTDSPARVTFGSTAARRPRRDAPVPVRP